MAAGYIFNLAGIPGLVRNCDYEAVITDASIRVRVGEMYTVITLNGLDIYFHRLTGGIDGVGFTPCCKQDCAPESIPALDQPVSPSSPAQKRKA